MAKPTIGVHSGLARTVLGPIPVEAMGVTLHALDNGGNFGTLLSNNPHLTSGT